MPPDLPIAGGAKSGVRDHVRWVPLLSVSPTSSLSSVDTDTDSDASSDLEDVTSSSSTSSSYTDAAAFPPSPPIHPLALKDTVQKATDYFSHNDKATFLRTAFPHDKKYTKAIPVHVQTEQNWDLALMEGGKEGKRVLYARGNFAQVNMRENLVELLDVADEELECDSLVFVLDKQDARFATTLHSLLYVGGVVMTPDAATAQPTNHILVGIDLA